MKWKMNIRKNCCGKGIKIGLIYGLIPHSFCILFIIFSVIGATAGTIFFKRFLLVPYFFPSLIILSVVFATISAVIYLRRNGCLCIKGAKKKWKYLSVLYGTTILVNLIFFLVIFPAVTNLEFSQNRSPAIENVKLSSLVLEVNIPCSGHAPLIMDEIKKIEGVNDVKFKFPNLFKVTYDSTEVSGQQILSLDIFKTYRAIIK